MSTQPPPSTPIRRSTPSSASTTPNGVKHTPPTGTWRHPAFDTITARKAASTFTDATFYKLIFNAIFLLLTIFIPAFLSTQHWYTTHIIRQTPSEIRTLILYLLYATRGINIINITLCIRTAFAKPDDFRDIALTPQQRRSLGLDPSTPLSPAIKPGDFVTPPRYPRSGSTPKSGGKGGSTPKGWSPGNSLISVNGGSAGGNGMRDSFRGSLSRYGSEKKEVEERKVVDPEEMFAGLKSVRKVKGLGAAAAGGLFSPGDQRAKVEAWGSPMVGGIERRLEQQQDDLGSSLMGPHLNRWAFEKSMLKGKGGRYQAF